VVILYHIAAPLAKTRNFGSCTEYLSRRGPIRLKSLKCTTNCVPVLLCKFYFIWMYYSGFIVILPF
jgi:hypothetical protein